VGSQTSTVEGLGVNSQFWQGKRVLVTGHTGFKGSWLCLWLQRLGANVAGYALPPHTPESLFKLAAVGDQMESSYGNILDLDSLKSIFQGFLPEIVFHLAAQPLVRQSYLEPIETYQTNIMGVVYLLEAVRTAPSCRVVVNVTSDKCYENREWPWGYRETDQMGGHDPYSSSKGCAELVTAAYRRSFFHLERANPVGVASARAGNVIGGGDFSPDRIVPDAMFAIKRGTPLQVRNPDAVRPWQHVLEPLSGYLLLAERLWVDPGRYAEGWNFGPDSDAVRPVRWIVERLSDYSDVPFSWEFNNSAKPHEARLLMLDSAKARTVLRWSPRWTLEQALRAVTDWHKSYVRGDALQEVVLRQIASYEAAATTDPT
jgi:CDP-glucose 4,6-dehydratase